MKATLAFNKLRQCNKYFLRRIWNPGHNTGIFRTRIINFEKLSHIVLVFPLLTLSFSVSIVDSEHVKAVWTISNVAYT